MPYMYDDFDSVLSNIRLGQNRSYKRRKEAMEQATKEDLYIIDPFIQNEQELDRAWEKYMSMTKPFRRKADWITLEYLGMTNQTIYDEVKNSIYRQQSTKYSSFLDGNVARSGDPLHLMESYTPAQDEVVDIDAALGNIKDLDLKLMDCLNYAKDNGFVLVNPMLIHSPNELEHAWNGYNSMVRRHQRMADWKTIETIGLTNQQIYMGLKKTCDEGIFYGQPAEISAVAGHIDPEVDQNRFLYANEGALIKNYFKTVIENGDITDRELAKALIQLESANPEVYDRRVATNTIDYVLDLKDAISKNVPSATYSYTDLPAFTPDEMIDSGVFPHDNPEMPKLDGQLIPRKVIGEDWFAEYCKLYFTGVATDEFVEANIKRVNELSALFKIPQNRDEKWRQKVLEHGWNPDVEFTPKSRAINDRLMNVHYHEMVNHYDFVDISDEGIVKEGVAEVIEKGLRPIYIVLIEGKSLMSDAIRAVTKSKFSHAMLSLDSSLRKCYSYGMDMSVKKTGSFIIEDILKKPKECLIRVYTVFVSNNTFETIKKNVDWFIENQKKTLYGWTNLITYLFHIPVQKDHTMFCSEFVDRMLKLGHIDFTKKSSSLIAPSDLEKAATNSKKVYTVFKDKIAKYNPTKIELKVKQLMQRAKTFGESTNYCGYISGELTPSSKKICESLLVPCMEVKEIPIKINKSGDVFVKNLKPIDYEAEYAASHKLLKSYEKTKNIEGMKNELAKLWAMLLQIEDKLYGTHSISSQKRNDLIKVRARIIGDFKFYLDMVQKSDKNFNFTEYYETTPYSNSTYKIHGSTVSGLMKIIKNIL